VLPDPRNMGVAVAISMPSYIRAEIYLISYPLPVNGRHLCFTTYSNTIEKVDPENMGVAVGILFLASLEAEIPLG